MIDAQDTSIPVRLMITSIILVIRGRGVNHYIGTSPGIDCIRLPLDVVGSVVKTARLY
jgi:hypothetical protein